MTILHTEIVEIGDELGFIMPEEIRAHLNVREGDRIDFRLEGTTIILRKIVDQEADQE